MTGWQLLGTIGAGFIVLAYWCVTTGKLKSDDPAYLLTNLIGAILLFISLIFNFNLGSILIECFWIGISVRGLGKAYG